MWLEWYAGQYFSVTTLISISHDPSFYRTALLVVLPFSFLLFAIRVNKFALTMLFISLELSNVDFSVIIIDFAVTL